MCLYPVSQTPCVTRWSHTGSIACTSRRTGSGLKAETVDKLWFSAMLLPAALPHCTKPHSKNVGVTEHLPCGCHLFSTSPEEPGLSCISPPQRVGWTYRPLPFCVDAPSPPVLLPSAVPSLFCQTNKNNWPLLQTSAIALLLHPPSSEPKGGADLPRHLPRKAVCLPETQKSP